MGIDIAKHEELTKMLVMIVRAKRDGMMDHRQAMDLWSDCLHSVGFDVVKKSDAVGLRRG